ncbi:MAG: efflux RND transporter periplasmic adaptor subunit [Deltaproteobacteria bacterium]|nr:efflux RND transporter periplasmic adaptor subunit [Deltaproteobacteria bacterium]
MTQLQRLIVGFAIGLFLVAGAIGITVFLVKNKPKGARAEIKESAAAVRVTDAKLSEGPVTIHGSGNVEASRVVALSPEVKGRATFVAKELVKGGLVKKGQTLLRLDDRDYRLAVEVEQSRVQKAELELTMELSRQKIAKREWDLLGDERPEEQAQLALRKPQLANAHVQLKSMKSGLKRAKLNLSRATLRAPFNAVVINENVEVGQLVGLSGAVATLAGTDEFWVTVSLPMNRLPALNLNDDGQGSKAMVTMRMPTGEDVHFEGRTLRLRESLDSRTRTAQLVVGVMSPLATKGHLPLLINSYVDVSIEGKSMPDGLEIPRAALRDGNTVWVVNDKTRLERRNVQVVWREPSRLLVKGSLQAGDRVVTSPMAMPIDGMLVKVFAGQATKSEEKGDL